MLMNDFDTSTWYGLDYTLDNLNATNAKLIEENNRFANLIIELREKHTQLNKEISRLADENYWLKCEREDVMSDMETLLQRYRGKLSLRSTQTGGGQKIPGMEQGVPAYREQDFATACEEPGCVLHTQIES
jgi:hypothetical protein